MRNHRKIKALRQDLGAEGYNSYCMLLETLTASENFEFTLKKEMEWKMLASDFGIETEKLKKIISLMEELELIQNDNGLISCESLNKRMQPLIDKRIRNKDFASRLPRDESGKFLSIRTSGVSVAETPQSKEKKSKVKESKEKEILISPSNITEDFLNNTNSEHRKELFEKLTSQGLDGGLVKEEMLKFINYWSELNKSGTKQRWELEKTFELKKRLITWFSRIDSFNTNSKFNKHKIITI